MGVSRWGPARTIFVLAPVLLGAPLYTLYHQFLLPTPNIHPYDPTTSLPHPSESTILSYAKYLSEDIGYRTPGTRQHAQADTWWYHKVQEVEELCRRAIEKEPGRKLECNVWRQQGSGSHRFDIMATRLYKTYVDLSNIILRISDGTERSKSDAVLVNAHLDSTLPSPGAADDALAVGVMLECARTLIETPGWEPTYAIIFLFNNAEESLQDGSHLYATQHETAPTVRAAVNLEAAGTTGPTLLFQATSEQMIEAYSHVPRPYGTIFANEIFSSGILLSDTDFRQFEQYLNVTGLDMAVVGNSYMYHMRGDLVENIQPGVAQHMADNTLALLRYLSSSDSPIPSLAKGFDACPRTVFMSSLHWFFMYSFTTAKIMYVSLFIASLALWRIARVQKIGAGFGAVLAAIAGAVLAANVVAFLMKYVLKKPLSWFKAEYHPLLLYAPAAISGMLIAQLPFSGPGKPSMERPIFMALLLFQSFLAAFGQILNIGSSAALFLGALGFFVALCIDTALAPRMRLSSLNGDKPIANHPRKGQAGTAGQELSLWSYVIAMLIPLTVGVQLLAATLVVFVPLTGRFGKDAPAEFIIASIVSILGVFSVSFTPALAHRFGPRFLWQMLWLSIVSLGLVMAFFYVQDPFDRMHQRRLFVVHKDNMMTGDQHLHIATADGAPGFDTLVHAMAERFGVEGVPPRRVIMDDHNGDWDILYPFSTFLSPYKIDLPLDPAPVIPVPAEPRFTVIATNDSVDDIAGTRRLTLKIDHPGIIWIVIAFDAHVLEWTLDNDPPDEFARHHIKEASFYGTETWGVSMLIKYPTPGSPEQMANASPRGLKVNFIGIDEKRMWPAKKSEADGSPAMKLFEELDAWLEERTGGSVDATLLGCVGGEALV
ncbi:hypothetical protein M404DRAFT_997720 [Pisolithus tinctorius Marx 270]|uniref:Peptide hydrolase n=1 Tax=Pisolithus tinctorius Marx 270 TaxID=870435 RepID=A0A0C3JEM4_PISTI|nr:hypothetical protein M404DRAFT_997720 [Pisolithus tinctorius Marx 270]